MKYMFYIGLLICFFVGTVLGNIIKPTILKISIAFAPSIFVFIIVIPVFTYLFVSNKIIDWNDKKQYKKVGGAK